MLQFSSINSNCCSLSVTIQKDSWSGLDYTELCFCSCSPISTNKLTIRSREERMLRALRRPMEQLIQRLMGMMGLVWWVSIPCAIINHISTKKFVILIIVFPSVIVARNEWRRAAPQKWLTHKRTLKRTPGQKWKWHHYGQWHSIKWNCAIKKIAEEKSTQVIYYYFL